MHFLQRFVQLLTGWVLPRPVLVLVLAVALAALTTTVGFGALMISHHQGIFSLGFISWTGSCVLAAAIILIPAILAVGAGKAR